VSNTLWAFANGGWPLPGAAAAALDKQLPAVLADVQCKPQEAANSLWAWSKLGGGFSEQLAAAAEAAIQRTAGSMAPQAASNTLWAFANGGWPLPSAAAAALEKQLLAALADAQCLPQAVSNSLWAWSKLGLTTDSVELRTAADAAVLRVASLLNSIQATQLAQAVQQGWPLSDEAAAAVERCALELRSGRRRQ
jgi:hypothetical protein